MGMGMDDLLQRTMPMPFNPREGMLNIPVEWDHKDPDVKVITALCIIMDRAHSEGIEARRLVAAARFLLERQSIIVREGEQQV